MKMLFEIYQISRTLLFKIREYEAFGRGDCSRGENFVCQEQAVCRLSEKGGGIMEKIHTEKGSVANCATVPGNATAARSSAAATRNTMALSKAIREAGDDCRHGGFLMKQPDKYAKVMRKLAGKVII